MWKLKFRWKFFFTISNKNTVFLTVTSQLQNSVLAELRREKKTKQSIFRIYRDVDYRDLKTSLFFKTSEANLFSVWIEDFEIRRIGHSVIQDFDERLERGLKINYSWKIFEKSFTILETLLKIIIIFWSKFENKFSHLPEIACHLGNGRWRGTRTWP